MNGIGRMMFVLLAVALIGLGLSGVAFAERPITFGHDGVAKIGETYNPDYTIQYGWVYQYSSGQHALTFVQDAQSGGAGVSSAFAAWPSGNSVLYSEGWEHGRNWSPTSVIAAEGADVFGVNAAATPGSVSYPDGIIHVVWYDTAEDAIKYARNTCPYNNGCFYEPAVIVNSVEAPLWGHSVAADSAGNAYVGWQDAYGKVWVSKIVDNAVAATTLVEASGGSSASPSIAVDSAGNVYVSWFMNGVHLSKSTDGGLTFSAPLLVSGEYIGGLPSLAVLDSSKIYIAWKEWGSSMTIICAHTSVLSLTLLYI